MRARTGLQNIYTVNYGISLSEPKSVLSFNSRDIPIIILGNMFHLPNIVGCLNFLSDVFPIVLESCPSAVLWIVGSNPDKRIVEAAKKFGPHVVITGKVASLLDYLRRAKVSICPVTLAIGVQTKILEALSVGTPVVSTADGNNGIGAVSGHALWVEDDNSLFAKRVTQLLDGLYWDEISSQRYRFVSTQHSWERNVSMLNSHLSSFTE